jgi:transcriptional regulator of arginine metabolism
MGEPPRASDRFASGESEVGVPVKDAVQRCPERASLSRTARQARIETLIESQDITSQAELSDLLAAEGITVSQGTLSRDLLEVGAVRVRGGSGRLVYAPIGSDGADRGTAEAKLARVAADVLVSADSSGNIVVLKTPPGAAQYFASVVDRANRDDILGTIAGDDTLLVVSRDAFGGEALAAWFASLANSKA